MSIQIYTRECEDCSKEFTAYQPLELKCNDCKSNLFELCDCEEKTKNSNPKRIHCCWICLPA